MATLVTVTCDRCGGDIPPRSTRGDVTVSMELGNYGNLLFRDSWDLCPDCARDVRARVRELIVNPPSSSVDHPAEEE